MNGATPVTDGVDTATCGPGWTSPTTPARDVARYRRVAAARDRFAAGSTTVAGVRLEILLSWYRCREQYRVDPGLPRAPAAADDRAHGLTEAMLFAELGALASGVAEQTEPLDAVVTTSDATGQILGSWGKATILDRAAADTLAPGYDWSERASGTNGPGTALETSTPVLVQASEHWCEGFHRWACLAASVRDPNTDAPLAVLSVSCRDALLPTSAAARLSDAIAPLEIELRRRSQHQGAQLVASFTEAAPSTRGAVAALDPAGKVVVANQEAALLLGIPPVQTPAIDPRHRHVPQLPELTRLVRQATARARTDQDWSGATQILSPSLDTVISLVLRPIRRAQTVIGVLVHAASGVPQEPVPAPPLPQTPYPTPIAGLRGSHLVLLTPAEIRYAESDRNTIWLITDSGRLRARARGFDKLADQLRSHGFLRVHRRFLVNPARIKEIEQGFKGALWVITDPRVHEAVPVSRRHAPELRRTLNL